MTPPDTRAGGANHAADRLQPSLLDRLTDDAPGSKTEPREARTLTRQALRAAVLRDLAWLFNSTSNADRIDATRHPYVFASVLNYGLPGLSGNFAASVDAAALEDMLRQAVIRFEPRILPDSIQVEAVLDRSVLDMHNQIRLILRALLWAQPVPLEVVLRTDIDLEEGGVTLVELRR